MLFGCILGFVLVLLPAGDSRCAAAASRPRRELDLLLGSPRKAVQNRWERTSGFKRDCTGDHIMPAAEKKKLVATADGELGLTMDPSLLRGATADLLIKNRSEIFSSNVLSQKDLAQLHESTAIVSFLHARRPRPTPSTRPRHSPVAVHTGLLLALVAHRAPRQVGGAAALPERAGGGRGDGRELLPLGNPGGFQGGPATARDHRTRLLFFRDACSRWCMQRLLLPHQLATNPKVLRSRSALLLPRQGVHRPGRRGA